MTGHLHTAISAAILLGACIVIVATIVPNLSAIVAALKNERN